MKKKFEKPTAIALIAALTLPLFVPFAQALEPGGSGGGDVIVMPHQGDDAVRLADPWAKSDAPATGKDCASPFKLPSQVENELGRVGYMLSIFGNLSESKSNEFIEKKVLHSSIRYCLVDELPKRRACENRMGYANLPDGAKVLPAACTEGAYTWVVKDIVKSLSVREQAKLYVHEGMRRTNTPEETIALVTDGLETVLEQYNQNLKGQTPDLSREQRDSLLEFRKNLALAGITSADPRDLTPEMLDGLTKDVEVNRGGALVYKSAKVHPSAYLGAGMIIGGNVGAGSKILNSQVDSDVTIGKNTTVVNSRLMVGSESMRKMEIGDRTRISNSTIYLAAKGAPTREQMFRSRNGGAGAMMENQYFGGRQNAKIGNNVTIQNSDVQYHYVAWDASLADGSQVINSKIGNTSLEKGAVVENSRLLQGLDYGSTGLNNLIQVKVGQGARVQAVQMNKGHTTDEYSFGDIRIGNNARISNIGNSELRRDPPTALAIGSLALGFATMGIGSIAMGYALKNTGNLFITEGARIDGRGRPACGRGQVVAFGTAANGEKAANFSDLQSLCSAAR